MNKQMKQHLEAVVEAIIFDDAAAAKDAFHNYLSLKTQSILVGEACEDEECECHDENDEPDVYIARIDFDEDGEAIYLDPTEEEFEAVKTAYEEMMNSSEE